MHADALCDGQNPKPSLSVHEHTFSGRPKWHSKQDRGSGEGETCDMYSWVASPRRFSDLAECSEAERHLGCCG